LLKALPFRAGLSLSARSKKETFMNTLFTHSLKTLALGLILAASVHSAQAQTAHTYVSGAGDDASPCSRTAPCATFQAAVNNTAAGGVVTALDAGDYGAVTITQAVTIDGTGVQASIVTNSSTDAITINDTANPSDTIILRHLALTGLSSSANGVVLFSGNLVVDDCKIAGFVNSYGLYLHTSGTMLVENTTVTGCSTGIVNGGSGLLSLRNVTSQGNQEGVDAEGGPVDISHSQITQNSSYGLFAYNCTLTASACMISGNGTAVYADSGSIIRLTNNDILNNTTGIDTTSGGGIVASSGNNRKSGNATSGSVTPGRVIAQQ
jgi:hypothetical protein